MWRSFFFAVGVMLIILGIECLVTQRFVVSQQARLPGFVKKIFDEQSPGKSAPNDQIGFPGNLPNGQAANLQQLANRPNPQQFNASGSSRFGPSRFETQYAPQANSSSGYGAGSFYGGQPYQNQARANPQFSLAGYGQQPANPAFIGVPPSSVESNRLSTQVLQTKDWMPWSLLAAGTLVVLYTNSSSRRFSNS